MMQLLRSQNPLPWPHIRILNLWPYVDGSVRSVGQEQKHAAKAVLDLSGYGSQLNLSAPASKDDGIANYSNIALAKNGEKRYHFRSLFYQCKTREWWPYRFV
jgi:hypothetical protein